MKLQVLQEDLSKALSVASRFASPKAQLPILGNALLLAKKSKLLVIATNLETSITLPIGAQVEETGDITSSAKVLAEIVSGVPKGSISITTAKEKINLSIESYKSSVAGMNSGDFPDVPQEIPEGALRIPTEKLKKALTHVLFAASTDETRPVLTGVLIILGKEYVSFIATDGFRLSKVEMPIKGGKSDEKIILPKNALSELVKLASGKETAVAIPKGESLAVFEVGDGVLSSRVIQGEFPNYEKIIPTDHKVLVDVDKEELLRAVKVASVFARDSANALTFNLSEKEIEIKAQSSQSGNQEIKVDAKVDGVSKDGFTIAFNYRFVEDVLGVIQGESVQIKFSDQNAAGVFLDPSDPEFLHLIMPVKL